MCNGWEEDLHSKDKWMEKRHFTWKMFLLCFVESLQLICSTLKKEFVICTASKKKIEDLRYQFQMLRKTSDFVGPEK